MQTIGAALAMMALISFFFLPDAVSAKLRDAAPKTFSNPRCFSNPFSLWPGHCCPFLWVYVEDWLYSDPISTLSGRRTWLPIGTDDGTSFLSSMGCIVMAIGLAVDYSVHICYRYHRSECSKTAEKVCPTPTFILNCNVLHYLNEIWCWAVPGTTIKV